MNDQTVTVDELIAELKTVSKEITGQVRTLAISVVALAWGILVSRQGVSEYLGLLFDKRALLMAIVFALLTLIVDYLQYVSGYIYSDKLRKESERTHRDVKYDYRHPLWQMRLKCFWIKQGTLLVAVFSVVFAAVRALWHLWS